jgi:hypothetical protein
VDGSETLSPVTWAQWRSSIGPTHGINRITSAVARLGVGRTQVMTTTGRKTGERRRVPVSPIVVEGVEYLVSPYGEVGWVHNVRARPNGDSEPRL